ncbi:MAG: endolytic transglycosylase MltG [Bauldia sp.]|uniref:endolytic transglycosylase MltG n=1 Tax=Bauldia sp. TaxID=2575872 RepID=UPI001D382E30|nr:endolytic transglycosylase MltG [Bauldia sp.]MCB1495893.1 endolytic transglycosylase MltG [Bauldia sp.]
MSDSRGDQFGSDADILSARLVSANRSAPKSPTEALQPESVPPPPQRSRAVRHPLVVFTNFVLTIIVVAGVALGGGLLIGKSQFDKEGALDQERSISVSRGTGLSAIADQLQREGAISSKWLFIAGVWLSQNQDNLKAGEYLIPAHASMADIMDTMVEGKSIVYSITIPEGLTSKQIVDRLLANDILVGEIKDIPPEGTLLPARYDFSRGDTRQNVISRMQRERDRVLTDVWSRRASDLPLKNINELAVLASIVEKETALADERSRVAAVFINRLRLNMRLQTDPTVIYGLFGGDGKPQDYSLTRADLEKETPYNTYLIDGLPPGPIANPGQASIEAAANPSRTRDLFFVADGSGGHAFAETYEEHLRNVARWREISAAPPAEADAAGDEPIPGAEEPLALSPDDEAAPAD